MLCFENDDVTAYYYEPSRNRMMDEDGYIIYNIFSIITPNQLFIFKQNKEYMLLKNIQGEVIELHYPEYSADWDDYVNN